MNRAKGKQLRAAVANYLKQELGVDWVDPKGQTREVLGVPFKWYPIDVIERVSKLGLFPSKRYRGLDMFHSDPSVRYDHGRNDEVPSWGELERMGWRDPEVPENLDIIADRLMSGKLHIGDLKGKMLSHPPILSRETDRTKLYENACMIYDYHRLVVMCAMIANNGNSSNLIRGGTEAQWRASMVQFKRSNGKMGSVLYDPERLLEYRDIVHELFTKQDKDGMTAYQRAGLMFAEGKVWGRNGWTFTIARAITDWFREERRLAQIRKEAATERGRKRQASMMADSPTLSAGEDWEYHDMLKAMSAREALSFLHGFLDTLKKHEDTCFGSPYHAKASKDRKICEMMMTGRYTHEEIASLLQVGEFAVREMKMRMEFAVSSDEEERKRAVTMADHEVRYAYMDGIAGDFFDGFYRKAKADLDKARAKKNAAVGKLTAEGVRTYDKPRLVDRSHKSEMIFG